MRPPVPIVPLCPQCSATNARLLTFNSAISYVDYFRCPSCGHVWNQPKPGETGPTRDVTPRDAPAMQPRRAR